MTPAQKLRVLIASRPAMPGLEDLTRWWRTTIELVPQVLAEVDVLKQEVRELEQQREAARAAARAMGAQVENLAAFADDSDPRVMATAAPLGAAQADLWLALGLDLDAEHARMQADIDSRCAVCGWTMPDPVNGTAGFPCRPGNCSMRPRPEKLYAPERAAREAEDIGGPAAQRTFEAGDVVRLRATDSAPAGSPMTIEDVCSFIPGKGIGVRCVWFDDDANLHRDVFDPSALEHTAPKEDARG